MGIKRNLFLAFITWLVVFHQATAMDIINNDIFGQQINVVENLIVSDTGSVNFENINICNTVFITNDGKINGTFNIYDGNTVFIQNSGSINSVFVLGNNSSIVQVIGSDKDVKDVNFNTDYSLLVNSKDIVSLNEVMNIGSDAKEIIFNDTILRFEHLNLLKFSSVTNPKIKLVGNNILYVDSISETQPILSNVSGNGTMYIYNDSLSPLYAIQSYVKDGNLFGKIVRETDYSKILQNNVGAFLNKLRIIEPDNKLLPVMDSAKSFGEMYKVMKDSVKLNPIKLMEPIRVFNDFNSLFVNVNSDMYGVVPIFIYSDSFYTYGAKLSFSSMFSDELKLSMSIYNAYTAFSDYVNEFNSLTNGAEVFADYETELYFVNFVIGASLTNFEIGAVFDGQNIIDNPSGISIYSDTNIGRKFIVNENFIIKPFVNVATDYISLSNQKDTDINTGVGLKTSILYNKYDISYEYGAKIRASASGQFGAAVNMNFISDLDGFTGSIEFGTLYDNDDFAYGIRAGASFDF